ncbi:TPT-domain-containing protein, partial [Fistulina hepatica ATCC 64428]
SQSLWLCLYFFFNLSLTIYNKKVLIHFPFPYALTATHAFCGAVGSYALVAFRAFKPQRLTSSEKGVVILFSVLYSINIVVSNMSLGLVTVPVHQVIRASCPVFTIIFSAVLLNSRSSRAKIVSLVPVMIGVGFATYGDYYFTPWGFFLTVLGTVLAALKTIFTNQTYSFTRPTLSLKPLSFLYYLSPLAFFQCVGLSIWTGEFRRIQIHYQTMDHAALIGLLMNGAIAFLLNVVSFNTNKKVGPLGMTVAANVKQALTILVAVAIFNLTITVTNGFGILLTLVGGAWYAKVEYQER